MEQIDEEEIIEEAEDEYEQGIKEVIAFGRASTGKDIEEEIVIEDDGISPDSWNTIN